jgi:hypothetical protein
VRTPADLLDAPRGARGPGIALRDVIYEIYDELGIKHVKKVL